MANGFLLSTPAGFRRLCVAFLNYHAGLRPEAAAESLVAASGLHAQKPRCSAVAAAAVAAAAAAAAAASSAARPQR